MARGKRAEKEKKERARKDRKLERQLKEEIASAKDVARCPVCNDEGRSGGCSLCGKE